MAECDRSYADAEDLKARTRIFVSAIQKLAAADAFRPIGLDRRHALWDSRASEQAPDLPIFTFAEKRDEGSETPVLRPEMPICEHVVADYQTIRLSLKAHPFEFLRGDDKVRGFIRTAALRKKFFGGRVHVAGIVLIRQRPGSAKGVCFITLKDESDIANLIVRPPTPSAQRADYSEIARFSLMQF